MNDHNPAPRPVNKIVLPPAVANKAEAEHVGWWPTILPRWVAEVADKWGLALDGQLDSGTEAFTSFVIGQRAPGVKPGQRAVLKMMVPRKGAAHQEASALRLARPAAVPRLLAFDPDRHALLTEALGPSLADLGTGLEQRYRILCDAASRFWAPVPTELLQHPFPTGASKARELSKFITARNQRLGSPCSDAVIDHALACAENRARADEAAPERARFVHGDVHQWNALSVASVAESATENVKLIDPDGLVAEPEYDLGVILREEPEESMADLAARDPRRRARWLAQRAAANRPDLVVDPEAVWEWAVVERVSTGLLATEIGLEPIASQMLAAANAIAIAAGGP